MKELIDLAEDTRDKLELQFDAEGVKFLDGFIERNKAQFEDSGWDGFIVSCGAFLGQAIIENYGGEWHRHEDGAVSVRFGEKLQAFPFAKVRKQFENGTEDSIYSFFTAIPIILKRQPGSDLE